MSYSVNTTLYSISDYIALLCAKNHDLTVLNLLVGRTTINQLRDSGIIDISYLSQSVYLTSRGRELLADHSLDRVTSSNLERMDIERVRRVDKEWFDRDAIMDKYEQMYVDNFSADIPFEHLVTIILAGRGDVNQLDTNMVNECIRRKYIWISGYGGDKKVGITTSPDIRKAVVLNRNIGHFYNFHSFDTGHQTRALILLESTIDSDFDGWNFTRDDLFAKYHQLSEKLIVERTKTLLNRFMGEAGDDGSAITFSHCMSLVIMFDLLTPYRDTNRDLYRKTSDLVQTMGDDGIVLVVVDGLFDSPVVDSEMVSDLLQGYENHLAKYGVTFSNESSSYIVYRKMASVA